MVAVLLLTFVAHAGAPALPTFEQYAVNVHFQGVPAKPDLMTHREAKTYRTELRREASAGPNFADHYTFIPIGAGTSTIIIAVVDAKNGRVFFPKGLSLVSWAGWWHEPYGPDYRRNSRLLVVRGQANSEDAPYGTSYFEWTGSDFKLLKFVERDRGKPPK